MLKRLSDFIKSYSPLLVFLGFVLNLFVVYRFERSKKPQVVYCVRDSPTNSVPGSASSASPVSSSASHSPVSSSSPASSRHNDYVNVPYHFFLNQGRRAVQMWGRFFSEGSPTSYGRIVKIFPDRIFLEGDVVIVNTQAAGFRQSNTNAFGFARL